MANPTRRAYLRAGAVSVAASLGSPPRRVTAGSPSARSLPPRDQPPVDWSVQGSGQLVAGGGAVYAQRDGEVTAYDPASGDPRWQSRADGASGRSYAQYHDGLVYVVGGGAVTAFDPSAGGDRAWSYAPENGDAALLTFHDGTAWVGVTGEGSGVDAVDPATGERRWHADADGGLLVRGVADGLVYAASPDGGFGLDAGDGGKRFVVSRSVWSAGFEPTASLLLLGNQRGELAAYDATGSEAWTFAPAEEEAPIYPYGTDAGPGSLFVAAEDGFHRVEPSTGESVWNADPFGTAGTARPDTIDEEYLYYDPGGRVLAVDRRDGSDAWHVRVREDEYQSPLPYVRTDDDGVVVAEGETVLALTRDGRPLWRWRALDTTVNSLVLDTDHAFVSAGSRTYALARAGPPGFDVTPARPIDERPAELRPGPLGEAVTSGATYEWQFRAERGLLRDPDATGSRVEHEFVTSGETLVGLTARTDAASVTTFQQVDVRDEGATPTPTATPSPTPTATPSPTPSPSPTTFPSPTGDPTGTPSSGEDDQAGADEASAADSPTDTSTGDGPGFGALAALASLGAVAWRRLGSGDRD